MTFNPVYLFELSLTLYFAALIVSVTELFRGTKTTSRIMISFAAAGFALQTANMVLRYMGEGYLPIASLHETAAFFAWCIVAIFLYLEFRYMLGLLGSFIMPTAFILMLSSSMLPRAMKPLPPILQSSWFGVHIVLAFLGNAAFAMACGIGVMYLIQEHNLKAKHVHGLFKRLPNLSVLDDLNYRLISLGFPLLTLAIISGVIWAQSALGGYWRWDPKEVWSLITWLIYALILHVRLTSGWRGRKVAILSIVGFAAVLFTFFGVNLLIKSLHSNMMD